MSRRAEGVQGIKWNAIGDWGRQIIGFVIFAVLARLLEPKTFGLVALISIYLAFINLFVTQGFGMTIIQRKDLQPGHLDTAFWISMVASVFFSVGTFLASGLIATFLGDPKLKTYVAVLSLDFIFMALVSVQSSLLVRQMRFFELAIRQLISLVCGGVTGIFMAWAGLGIWSLIGQSLVSSFVAFLTTWKVSTYRPKLNVSWKHLRDLWSYSWAVLASNFMNFISGRTDQFFVGRSIDSVSLGFYSISQRIIGLLVSGLTGSVTLVAIPMLSKSQDEKDKIPGIIYHILEMASLICYPLYFGLVCLAPDAIVLVFGAKWSNSAVILQIFTFGEIIALLGMFNYSVFISLGKPQYNIWILLARAAGAALAALIGLRWGMIGIAVGMVVNNACALVVSISLLRRIVPVSFLKMLLSVRIPILCAAVMTVGVLLSYYLLLIHSAIWLRVLVCAVLGALVYVSVLLVVSRRLPREALEYVKLLLKGKKGKEQLKD